MIASISVPDIRDYRKINEELVRLLNSGHNAIRLEGANGQRLLASGLVGEWHAIVVIDGDVGLEVAAGLDAPRLVVEVKGKSADGAGSSLKSGVLVLQGETGDCLGYAQKGGRILAKDAGHRAGLMQSGGDLLVYGKCGRLFAERQSGGLAVVRACDVGPHSGRGRSGGNMLLTDQMPDLLLNSLLP